MRFRDFGSWDRFPWRGFPRDAYGGNILRSDLTRLKKCQQRISEDYEELEAAEKDAKRLQSIYEEYAAWGSTSGNASGSGDTSGDK